MAAPPAAPKPGHGVAAAPPAQPGSPQSGDKIALGPAKGSVSLMAGPVSVPKGTGPVRNGTFTTFELTDRVTLDVNAGSGNLLIRSTDITLPGIARNLVVGAAYNSLLIGSDIQQGSLGHGWRTRSGVDVKLIKADDNSVTYVASDGVVGRFTPSGSGYTSPGEFKATLAQDGSGWKLTEHESGQELYFTSAGLLDRTLDRNDNVTDYSYDASGNLTSITSDRGAAAARRADVTYTNGRITRIKQTINNKVSRRVEYSYDSSGNLREICFPTLRDVRFQYDSSHRITKILSGILDSDSGAETEITYDSQHRVTSVTRYIDKKKDEAATTRWAYPSSTQTLMADANTDLSKAVASVPRTTYTVNAEKRVTKTVDPEGHDRDKTYTPYHDVASSVDALGNTSTNTYGANGGQSLTTATSASGADVSVAYANASTPTNPTGNFQPSSGTDPQGNNTTYAYNGAGNRASAKDALAAEAKLEHNSDGTVKSSTDPANGSNATTYQYNADKQTVSVTPPTGNSLGQRTFGYDEFGRLATSTDGAGRTITYEYDLDDRIALISYSDNTTDVEYGYDGAGNMIFQNDADGWENFYFDRLNRLVERNDYQQYVYDPVGNLIQLSDGRDTLYEYNTRNLLTSAEAGNALYTFEYDDEGRRTYTRMSVKKDKAQPPNVAETHNTYDRSGRLSRTTSKRWQRVNGADQESVVYDVSYCFAKRVGTAPCSAAAADDTGLRQWQTEHHRGGAVSVFSYDAGNRLTRATNVDGKTYDYEYDANGNRKTQKVDGATVQTLTFNSANQITSSGFTYDGAGSQRTGSAIRSATYNAAGQMRTNNDAGGHADVFNYAGPDQIELASRETADFTHEYWYGLDDENGLPVLEYYTADDDHHWHFIERDGLGSPLGVRAWDDKIDDWGHYFYVLDGVGSVVALISGDGALAATYTYDPYGRIVNSTANDEEAHHTVLGFAGGLRGADLTKFGKRWYDPGTGRFTQQDNLSILGDPAQGNRYAYAACNPVSYTDPTGNCSISSILGFASGIIGGAGTAVGTWVYAGAAAVPFTAGAILIGTGVAAAVLAGVGLGFCLAGE
jgi:RHS repeat-associated protein